MKIEIDERFLEEDIKVLGLSVRTYNALTRRGYGDCTIGYVKKLLEEDELWRIKGLGELGQQEVKIALQNFVESNISNEDAENNTLKQPLKSVFDIGDKELINLHNNGIWIVEDLLHLSENQLAEIIEYPTNLEKLISQIKRYKLSTKTENKPKQFEGNNRVKTTQPKQYISGTRFDVLMGTFIEKLDMSVRSFNCLKRVGVDTVEDLVKKSEEDLIKVRALNIKSRQEIIKKIHSLGLELRPEDVDKEDWIKELKSRLRGIKLVNNENDLDINEIPEKYRKTYAIGAGVVAEQELKQNSRVVTSKRIPTKSNVVADKPALPKVKISKQAINEMSDKQLLKVIAEDISVIESLDEGFITKYRKELMKIILTNSTLDVDKRLELIELINNTQINAL